MRKLPLVAVAAALLQVVIVQAQQRGGTPVTDKVPPVNSGANPYRVIRDWAQFGAEARPWGGPRAAFGALRRAW